MASQPRRARDDQLWFAHQGFALSDLLPSPILPHHVTWLAFPDSEPLTRNLCYLIRTSLPRVHTLTGRIELNRGSGSGRELLRLPSRFPSTLTSLDLTMAFRLRENMDDADVQRAWWSGRPILEEVALLPNLVNFRWQLDFGRIDPEDNLPDRAFEQCIVHLLRPLENHPTLRRFTLWSDHCSARWESKTRADFASLLSTIPYLTRLSFSSHSAADLQALAGTSLSCRLREFVLHECLQSEQLEMFARFRSLRVFQPRTIGNCDLLPLATMTMLEEVRLICGYSSQLPVLSLVQSVRCLHKLTSLQLDHHAVSSEDLCIMLEPLPLRTLHLTNMLALNSLRFLKVTPQLTSFMLECPDENRISEMAQMPLAELLHLLNCSSLKRVTLSARFTEPLTLEIVSQLTPGSSTFDRERLPHLVTVEIAERVAVARRTVKRPLRRLAQQ